MATGGTSRKHVVVFSPTCLFLENDKGLQPLLKTEIDQLSKSNHFELHFTSHSTPSKKMLAAISQSFNQEGCFQRRGDELRNFIKERQKAGDVVIIIGAVDEDLHVAASTKSFLISAQWVPCEEKVNKYGVPAPAPEKMRAILDIIVNQTSWYYSCTFDEPVPTKVVTLCLANTYSASVSDDEKAMAEKFQAILKNGADDPVMRQALLCHLMAAIAHDDEFKDVKDWAVTPSSSVGPNETMEELKEHVRYMMNGRKPEPIFIRHKATNKSRFDRREVRQQNKYCQKHFESIYVNDKYKGKLRDRVVCVFDDYLTHGSTFESLRNLLVSCKVKKIIFVAVGKFKENFETFYFQKSFSIEGDVHKANNYTATFKNVARHAVEFDDDAKRSLGDLRDLADHLQ